jgi:hypothetical protein
MNITREYLKAGNAIFKVSNPAGETIFVRIQRGRVQNGVFPYWVTISTLDGALRGYEYVGKLHDNGRVIATRTTRHPKGSRMFNIASWAIKCVWVGQLPEGYKIEWAGRCGKCGRRVTEHTNGFGPECYRSIGNATMQYCASGDFHLVGV